ncbi:MAG: hypothetical protein ACPL1Z_05750 [Candidatus Bathyarchaeales archaeon]
MAGLNLNLQFKRCNGNPSTIIEQRNYYIKYKCGECSQTHSVHATIRKHKGGYYTFQNTLANVKVKVANPQLNRASLLLGAYKLLDALDIKYVPESVRLVKA